ncbi:MAG TPA: hydrogenase maturation protease [Gaiellaceae bacterium]|nr:hydrogenase maturation protease [Gaiellaceae bacterium]
MTTCVVCVGNALRGDDAAGLEVLRLLEGTLPEDVLAVACEGEPVTLLSLWEDCETAIVVDATQSGAEPGTVRRLPAHEDPLPNELRRTSTHLLGVAEAVELARALGKLPARTIVYGIEGGRWETGAELTPEVAEAAGVVAASIRREVGAVA